MQNCVLALRLPRTPQPLKSTYRILTESDATSNSHNIWRNRFQKSKETESLEHRVGLMSARGLNRRLNQSNTSRMDGFNELGGRILKTCRSNDIFSNNLDRIRQLNEQTKQIGESLKATEDEWAKSHQSQWAQLNQLLQQGTFGKVYRGTLKQKRSRLEKTHLKIVAVKVVTGLDLHYLNRQLQVCEYLRKHPSPYLVRIHSAYLTLTDLHITMDLYPQNLTQYLAGGPSKSALDHKLLVYHLVRAVVALHSRGICHRDIRGENVLVSYSGKQALLCDFGASKWFGRQGRRLKYQVTPSDQFQSRQHGITQQLNPYVGSRYTRAPELLLDCKHYSYAVDIWSLGCIIGETILRRPLFIGTNQLDQLVQILRVTGTPKWSHLPQYRHLQIKLPNVPESSLVNILPSTVPTQLIDLMSKMLRIDPRERINPLKALTHSYFDELRLEQTFAGMKDNVPVKKLFDFDEREFYGWQQLKETLVPKWVALHG